MGVDAEHSFTLDSSVFQLRPISSLSASSAAVMPASAWPSVHCYSISSSCWGSMGSRMPTGCARWVTM